MRRVELFLMLAVAAALLSACRKPPETAATIAKRVVEAHGGAKALTDARGFLFHGEVRSLADEEQAKVWILYRRPNQLRVVAELENSKEDRLYLGGDAWIDSGNGFEKATGLSYDLMKFQAEHLGIPFGLKQNRYRIELLGEVVAGEPVKLLLTDPAEAKTTITIDPINSVVRMAEREIMVRDKLVTFTVVYEEYRPVKGMQVPFRMLNFVNGEPIGRTEFQSVQTNPSIPEKVFSAPGSG